MSVSPRALLSRSPIPFLLALACCAWASVPPALAASGRPAGKDLVQPADLAKTLSGPAARRPLLVHVGFEALYRGGHIPGSVYAGPASRPEGIQALRAALQPVPRTRSVVLYCGCCPWPHCPNVAPALQAARAMGFRNLRVLYVANDLQHDWADKGLPLASGSK